MNETEIRENEMGVVTHRVEDGIGVVTVDSPPVNALGAAVRVGLDASFKALATDAGVQAIVLICGGRTFFAGADISEFGKPTEGPGLEQLFEIIENGPKPVVAAIHGSALGGGFELALICPFRIAVPSAVVGLPEVNLGLLPGAGGTQRLPRVVGPEIALDLITSGRSIGAPEALALGLLDALADEGRLREDAIAFARTIVADGRPVIRVRDREDKIAPARGRPEIFEAFRDRNARAFRGFAAPGNIIAAIQAAVDLPFEEGMRREYELFRELLDGPQSAAQRYAFFAQRATSKVPDLPADTPTSQVRSVGIIGAGTMGGGIAMNFANVGLPVTLAETNQDGLDRGLSTIRRNYEASARKGRLTSAQVEERMASITPTLDLSALADVDLVIEAIYESLPAKTAIFAQLADIVRPGAILATNTSFLDVNQIAAATARPENVLGMHFFSPANVMRLLEVVRTATTAPSVLMTVLRLAKTIGKVPVVSGVCHGFIANRLMSPRGHQADQLALSGTTPADVDRVLYDYGFAMGQFQMMDLVGLDVIGRDSTERTLSGDLVARGRLGQKQGGGFYDYDENRRPTPSPVAAEVIAAFGRDHGVERQAPKTDDEILAWLLYPVVNEGARILDEGIALRASDIDVAAMLGYNWPAHTGGPMFWADSVGLPAVLETLRSWEAQYGERYRPSPLLERLVAAGETFTRG